MLMPHKLYAYRLAKPDVATGIGEQSRACIAPIHLNDVAVATCHEQILAVWRDGKIAWVRCRRLEPHLCEQSRGSIDGKHRHALVLQSVRCIEEFAVGRQVYVGTPRRARLRCLQALQLAQRTAGTTEHGDAAVKLTQEIGHIASTVEHEMARSSAFRRTVCHGGTGEERFATTHVETPNAVVAKIGGEHVATVGRHVAAVDVRHVTHAITIHVEILRLRTKTAIGGNGKDGDVAAIIVGRDNMSAVNHHVARSRTWHLVALPGGERTAPLATNEPQRAT